MVRRLLVMLVFIFPTQWHADLRRSFVITEAVVFTGTEVLPQATVVVRDGRIAAFGRRVTAPYDAIPINGRGATVLPGFIDAYAEVTPDGLTSSAVFGVTTVLDQSGTVESQAGPRAALIGPGGAQMADFLSGGAPLDSMNLLAVRSLQDAQNLVDQRIAGGSNYLRFMYPEGTSQGAGLSSSRVVLDSVLRAARRREQRVIVRVSSAAALRDATNAKPDAVAPLFVSDSFDARSAAEIAFQRVFVVPTVAALRPSGAVSGLLEDSLVAPFITPAMEASLRRPVATAAALPRYADVVKAVGLLARANARFLVGSNAPGPGTAHGITMHEELQLLVDAGLSPVQALVAATSAPADLFGLTDRGRIAYGMRADLVLVWGDATRDISATRAIMRVWRGGVEIDRDQFRLNASAARRSQSH